MLVGSRHVLLRGRGQSHEVTDKTAGFTPATRYTDPATGKFIVVNNQTGNVIQSERHDQAFFPQSVNPWPVPARVFRAGALSGRRSYPPLEAA